MTLVLSTGRRTDRNPGAQWRVVLYDDAGRVVRGASFWDCTVWTAIAAATKHLPNPVGPDL